MKIKAILKKPYTETQRVDFIVHYNHNLGYEINETDTELQALGYTEEEKEQQEKERIKRLSLTAADVERAIYKAKGMDFEDILKQLSSYEAEQLGELDLKALKIELKANNFYRGNPYIEQVGALLGFTPQMLDEFFETGDYTKLVAPPEEADNTEETTTPDPEITPEEEITGTEEEEVNGI